MVPVPVPTTHGCERKLQVRVLRGRQSNWAESSVKKPRPEISHDLILGVEFDGIQMQLIPHSLTLYTPLGVDGHLEVPVMRLLQECRYRNLLLDPH